MVLVLAMAIALLGGALMTVGRLYIATRGRHTALVGCFPRSIRGDTLMTHTHHRPRMCFLAASLAASLSFASVGAAHGAGVNTVCNSSGKCATVTCDGSLTCINDVCSCNGKTIDMGKAPNVGPCPGEQTAVHKNGGGKVSTKASVEATVFVSADSAVCQQAKVSGPVRLQQGSFVNGARVSGQTTLTASIITGAAVISDSTLENTTITGSPNVSRSQLSGSTVTGDAKIDNSKLVDTIITGNASVIGRTLQDQVLTQ